jgi:hypothetical protein
MLLPNLGDLITFFLQQILAPARTLASFITSMPIMYTTGNPIVIAAWTTMTIVADTFLGLFVIIGTIQIMYSDAAGGLRMPLGTFLGRAVMHVIFIHLSPFMAEQLLNVNNLLSGVAGNSAGTFLQTVAPAPNGNIFTIILTIVLTLIIIRLEFQGIKRIVRFNLLFVLLGPAIIFGFFPATDNVTSTHLRILVATSFEQFVQFLALTLAIQFVRTIGTGNSAGLLLTIAVFTMVAEVPILLGQIIGSSSSRGGGGGAARLLQAAALAKLLL